MLDDNKFILKTHKLIVTAYIGNHVKVKQNRSEGTRSYFEHHTLLLLGYTLHVLAKSFSFTEVIVNHKMAL